jgi:hypothetical protein
MSDSFSGVNNYSLANIQKMHVSQEKQKPIEIDGQVIPGDHPLAMLVRESQEMIDVMATPEQQLMQRKLKIDAAKALLPYVRPKLAQVEVKGQLQVSYLDALRALDE